MGLENLPDIMTVKELADFIKISEITIKRALKSGELKGFKVAGNWRIERESVLEWVKKEK